MTTYTCTRCHGTGHYSFNLVKGTVCFGCNGTGKQKTKTRSPTPKWAVFGPHRATGNLVRLYNVTARTEAAAITSALATYARAGAYWKTTYSLDGARAIKPGDKVAINARQSPWIGQPQVDYQIAVVERLTATQIVAKMKTEGELRIRRNIGNIIDGRSTYTYVRAIEATPQILADHEAQIKAQNRYFSAKARINKLEQAITRRILSVDQMEAIADAYEATLPKVAA